MEVPPGNEQVAALERAALIRAEQNRIKYFKKKMKELIGKFTSETNDSLFELKVVYNYKGGYFLWS
jgi:hypothetical protein